MNNFSKFRIPFSLMICLGLYGGAAQAINLLDAYEQARQYDANYMTAVSNYEAAKQDLPLAESANRPDISSSLGLRYNDDTFDPDGAPSNSEAFGQGDISVDLNQNVYNRAIRYDIQSASYSVDIARLQLLISEEDLISRTVSLYLNVLAALDNQDLAERERTANKKQLDLATQRLEVGLGTKTDEFDARARFESSNAELIRTQNAVINAQQELEALMGQSFQAEPKKEIKPLDNDKVTPELVKGDAWVAQVLPHNRAYRIKQKLIRLQEVEIARSEDARIPSLGLTAGVRAADSGAGISSRGGDSQNWTVGLRASLPIYQGGSIKLRQIRAGHAFNAASYDAEQSRRDTDRLIRAARRGVESLQRQVAALKESVRASISALDSKEEGFKAGVTTNIDVLNAQRDLFRAGRDYLQASYDLVNAIVILERAAGELDGNDVRRINGWLK